MTFAGTSSNGQDAPKPTYSGAFRVRHDSIRLTSIGSTKAGLYRIGDLEDRGGSLRAPIPVCVGGDDVELPGRYQPVVPHDRQCQLGREGIVHPSKILGQMTLDALCRFLTLTCNEGQIARSWTCGPN